MSGPCFTYKRFINVIETFDNFKEATSHKHGQKITKYGTQSQNFETLIPPFTCKKNVTKGENVLYFTLLGTVLGHYLSAT